MSCHGPFWERDHIDTCFQQRYVQLYPMAITLLCSLAVSLWTCAQLIRPQNRHARRKTPAPLNEQSLRASSTPAPPQHDLRGPLGGAPIYEKPEGRTNKDAFVVIRHRTTGDKTRLIAELVLALGQLLVSCLAWLDTDIFSFYKTHAPQVPFLMVLQALYLAALVSYRVAYMNCVEKLPGHTFVQCAWLYTVALATDVIVYYDMIMTGAPGVMLKVTLVLVVGSVLRWVVLFSSPVGDVAPRIYTVPGITPSKEPTASLFRTLACMRNSAMVMQAASKPVEVKDIWELREDDHAYNIIEKFSTTLPNWSLPLRLLWAFRFTIFMQQLTGIFGAIAGLLPTIFVNLILRYLEDESAWPRPVAYLFVVGLFVCYTVQTAVGQQSFYLGRRASVQVRATLMLLIYRKALLRRVATVTTETNHKGGRPNFDPSNTGAIINLISVDTFKIAELCAYLHYTTGSIFGIAFSVYLLFRVLGWSALAGCAVLIVMLVPSYYTARRQVQNGMMVMKDKRVELTNELLGAIRIIKLLAWEDQVLGRVLDLRKEELRLLLQRFLWSALNYFTFCLVPLFSTLVTFYVFVRVQGRALTPSVAFTAIAIFNVLRYPLMDLSKGIARVMAAETALARISTYLEQEETPKFTSLNSSHVRGPDSPEIGFEKATLSWCSGGDGTFRLRDIDLKLIVGDLNVIVGPTGSGKTSILLGLLGEMTIESGKVWLPSTYDRFSARVDPVTKLANTVAYCPQQPWLVNDTIRNNILFAARFDRERYETILDSCQLRRLLGGLKDGDQTIIGDKGFALSNGQKQRVSLARALYSNSRHIIIDDCLSAVDSHTAEALFNEALTGHIASSRTVILVSHNVALTVGKAAQVVVMDRGRVRAVGTPDELHASGVLGCDTLIPKNVRKPSASSTDSIFSRTVKTHVPTPEEVLEHVIEDHSPASSLEESRGLGSIPLSTYKAYASAFNSTSWWIVAAVAVLATPAAQYFQNHWLRLWTASQQAIAGHLRLVFAVEKITMQGDFTAQNLGYYAGVYALIGLFAAAIAAAREAVMLYGSTRASRTIFERLITRVVRARIAFFNSTPAGSIVNRFSKDVEAVDQELIPVLGAFVGTALDAAVTTAIISFVTPQFLPFALVICVVYYVIGKLYLTVSQDLKRYESVSRSPIFQQFGETLAGAVSIRAFGDLKRFEIANMNSVDFWHRPYMYLWMSNRWLSTCSAVMSMMVCVLSSFFIIHNSASLSAPMAGISLSYAMMFGDAVLMVVRMYAEVVVNMNSMERIEEYTEIESEAPPVIPESRPPTNWPSKGEIDIKELSLKYGENSPEVIKKMSLHIPGGLKVGFVGHTGAGKSTMFTALFRLLEPSHGSIVIDGVDISTIGLHDLRSRLAIIPQDPALFSGTLRSNLDLFDEFTDQEILTALARVKLIPSAAEACSETANQFADLDSDIQEGGSNLSQGQRQLLCLARSLLKQPRIMLLDEATASIGYDTDAMIQTTIREQFTNVTILTIAHRLRTVADYDRIVVLKMGELVQFGSPAELLADKDGLFYSMCEKSGELESLIELANST